MRKRVLVVAGCCVALLAIGSSPRYLEELRVGGGFGDPVDGGADFEADGDVSIDGDLVVDGGDIGVAADMNLLGLDSGALSVDGTLSPTGRVSVGSGAASRNAGKGLVYGYGGDSGSTETLNWRLDDAGAVLENDGDLLYSFLCPNSNTEELWFGDEDSQNSGRLRYLHSSDTMEFWAANGARLTLTSTAASVAGDLSVVGDAEVEGDLEVGADFEVEGGNGTLGLNSSVRGFLTLWDGSGGNTPGCVRFFSPNGTSWYLFVEDDGTLKIHSSMPASNSDGAVVGTQW